MSAEEIATARQYRKDLEFLLAPEPQEYMGRLNPLPLGGWFAGMRRSRGLLQEELAPLLGVKQQTLGGIERGESRLGATLADYFAYASYLGVSLKEAFMASVDWPLTEDVSTEAVDNKQEPPQPTPEDTMLERVLKAVNELRSEGKGVSQVSISKRAGVSRGGMRHYPRVTEVLRGLEEERLQKEAERASLREQELLVRVETAIARLKADGMIISQTRVSKMVGVCCASLNYYPQVRACLRAAAEGECGVGAGSNGIKGVCKGTSEEEVLAQVASAIESLQRRGKKVTPVAVARLVNISTGRLRQYEQVRALLDHAGKERQATIKVARAEREAALLQRVKSAARAIQEEGKAVTQLGICEKLGVSSPTLLYYPSVSALMERLESERRAAVQGRRLSREEALLVGVHEAMAALEESGQAVTQEAVGRWLGMTEGGLRKYPRVREVLQEVKSKVREERSRQQNHKKKALVHSALRAIKMLEQRGNKVTYRALEGLVRKTASCLRRYPQIKAAVEASLYNPRNCKRESHTGKNVA